MKLSIIVPVFNEERTVSKVLKIINKIDYGIPFEVIVVNDGSTDNTLSELLKTKHILQNIKVLSYKKNKGKGYAVRLGLKKSDGDIVIIQDADLEYNPEEIPRLIKPILEGEYKVIYGSRFLGKSKNMGASFLFGNMILRFITNTLFNSHLTDPQTCYKALHRDVINKITLKENGFAIEAEITAQIMKNKFSIKELPITFIARSRKAGKKIRWRDGLKNLRVLLRQMLGGFL